MGLTVYSGFFAGQSSQLVYYSRFIGHVVRGVGGVVASPTVSLEVTVELIEGLAQL